MPKWYLDCVASMESKGKEHKEAQRMCAILYQKKFHKSVREFDKKSKSEEIDGNIAFTEEDLKRIEKPEFVLNYLFNKE